MLFRGQWYYVCCLEARAAAAGGAIRGLLKASWTWPMRRRGSRDRARHVDDVQAAVWLEDARRFGDRARR